MWADNETEVDLLGFDFLVDTLFVALTEPRLLPLTVGLLGDWGSGKSSLIAMAEEALADDDRDRALLDAGGEIRVAPGVPMKLLVRDGVEAMISLRDPATGQQGLTSAVIRHPDLVGPLQLLFNREWRKARRMAPGPAEGRDG